MTDVTEILNWRALTPLISTSGQPTEAQLAELARLGTTDIINLGPHDNDGALSDEAGSVAALGMTYHYLPVVFDRPTDHNYAEFAGVLTALAGEKIHVHCIYNARVSAFFYRYAKDGLGLSKAAARANMHSVWKPGADWADFIADPAAAGQPNQYAGDDY